MSYSGNDTVSESTTSASPSQGVTITSVANNVVNAISTILIDIAQAITENMPFIMFFVITLILFKPLYKAAIDTVRQFFRRHF